MLRIILPCLISLYAGPKVLAADSAKIDGTRDLFLQPFSSDSPWNTPLGDAAKYEAIPHITTYPGGINFKDRWTTGIYQATTQDRKAELYIYKGSVWALLAHKKKLIDPATTNVLEIKTFGNDPAVEALLRTG